MPKITLRKVTEEDSSLIFSWRNHPDTRRHFNDFLPLERAGHDAWLVETLANPRRHLFIATDANAAPVGVLRFDGCDDGVTYEISIYLDPVRTNQGFGKAALAVGMQWLGENTDAVKARAVVLEPNVPSRQMFERLNFKTVRRVMECEIKR